MSRFWRIVVQITGWHIAASMCYYAVYAGTPLFRDAFELSGFTVGLIITALTLGYAVFQLPVGMATDRFGEHTTLTIGLLGLAVGLVLVVHAPTYVVLLPLLFVMGSMYGTAAPGSNKAIFDNIKPGRQHSAIGIKQIGPTIGSAISAILVTSLVGVIVWNFGFLLVAGISFITAVVFYITYSGTSQAAATMPDFRGLLKNRALLLVLLAGTFIGAGFYTTIGYTVLFIDEAIGASVAIGGVILAILQITSSAGKIGIGWLADALPGDPQTVTLSLLGLQMLAATGLFFFLAQTTTPLTAGIVLSLLGITALGATGLYYSVISTIVQDSNIGAASAAGSLATTISGLFAPPLYGYLTDTSGYGAAWSFLGLMALLATLLITIVFLQTNDLPRDILP